jgi:hypothetical protein
MQLKYKGKTKNGLIHDHEYIAIFTKPTRQYVYTCNILFDVTTQEEIDVVLYYASQISIEQNFDYDELEIDNE